MAKDLTESYEWFFRTEFPQVVRSAYLVMYDQEGARDVAQEAFVQALRHWPKVSRYDKPEAWVRRVAIRLAVKAAKKQSRLSPLAEDFDGPSRQGGRGDPDLARAVATLPGKQRAAVVLFYFEDRPISEIGEILDCSEATAKVHLHRARKKLALLLGEEVMADVT